MVQLIYLENQGINDDQGYFIYTQLMNLEGSPEFFPMSPKQILPLRVRSGSFAVNLFAPSICTTSVFAA